MSWHDVNHRRLVKLLGMVWLVFISVVISYTLQPTTSGYTAAIANSTNTAASATWFTCQNAYSFWAPTTLQFGYALTDIATATAAADFSGNATANRFRGAHTVGTAATSCPRDTSTSSYTLNGTTSYLANTAAVAAPATYAVMVWFKTSAAQGQLAGYGNSNNGNSATHDRQIYIDSTGKIQFYVNPTGGAKYAASTATYNDNNWHFMLAQQSGALGMQLYVDGALVGSNATATTAASYTGNWRFGQDVLTGLTNAPTSAFFSGQMRYAGYLTTTLTATQISAIYRSGTAN